MEINSVIELVFRFFIFVMVVFTLTSGVLYSEIVHNTRDCWVSYFKERKNIVLNKLQYLGICSLCLSFHVANVVQWLFMPVIDISLYIGYSLAACGLTWILTTIVNSLQWHKVFHEAQYNEIMGRKENK